jgi:hypothetical protein
VQPAARLGELLFNGRTSDSQGHELSVEPVGEFNGQCVDGYPSIAYISKCSAASEHRA